MFRNIFLWLLNIVECNTSIVLNVKVLFSCKIFSPKIIEPNKILHSIAQFVNCTRQRFSTAIKYRFLNNSPHRRTILHNLFMLIFGISAKFHVRDDPPSWTVGYTLLFFFNFWIQLELKYMHYYTGKLASLKYSTYVTLKPQVYHQNFFTTIWSSFIYIHL